MRLLVLIFFFKAMGLRASSACLSSASGVEVECEVVYPEATVKAERTRIR